ncbi:TetR/AcrR family transcriptional regulator [Spongiactinospora sp. 9N601]|uniref:TetR/AcrR family transcriptional regulator n=1 Tax=Spongiactinospora sp. 9N601 TaxID=3375149 RepID=UPI0037A8ABDD
MPKIVDADLRRHHIVEAVFRLILREGVPSASLRKVADEAGLNVGSVRHYFANHEDLLTSAAQTIVDRISARIEAHLPRLRSEPDKRPIVEDMLAELLPLDARRRDESTIAFAFVCQSRWDPQLRPLAEQLLRGPRQLVRRILDAAQVRDRDDHVERLCALIDGLAFKAIYVPTADDASGHLRLIGKQLDHILSDR